MRLGRTLYDGHGRVLLRHGTLLRDAFIARLYPLFSFVYIDDEESHGIEVPETIPMELRLSVQNLISAEWQRIRSQASFERVTFERRFADKLRRNMKNLLDVLNNTTIIEEDLASLASHDNSTYVHSMNVTIYSLMIGSAMHLGDSTLIDLALGAILHDIGKLWIPLDVLNKPDRLSLDEFERMKRHTEIGHDILAQQIELSYAVANCALQHHERISGNGYPNGITGDDMHLFSKIIAVADVYDAMVMDRPYREGCAPGDVMEYLFSRVGVDFDLDVVSLFSRKVALYPVGTNVVLSDNTSGIVARLLPDLPSRPIVRLLADADGMPMEPTEVDLSQVLNLTITHSKGLAAMTVID